MWCAMTRRSYSSYEYTVLLTIDLTIPSLLCRIRCYDVHDLTMKFERYVTAEVVDMQLLGEDYGKMALLLDDRTVAFHAHYGHHTSVRIPKFGRSMAYEPTTCELLIAASGSEVYRLNLEEGRFTEPWEVDGSHSISATTIAVAPTQPLAAVGCEDGIVRFWDNRSPDTLLKPFLKLDVQSATNGFGFADDNDLHGTNNIHEITSLGYDPSGLYMAAGTAGGLVALYDIRSSRPLHIQEHKLGMPIHNLKFHSGSGCVMSLDDKLVKIWRYKSSGDMMSGTGGSDNILDDLDGGSSSKKSVSAEDRSVGSVVANIEGTGKFTDFIVAGDENDPTGDVSGLILCATDQPKLDSFYVPKVGLAPKWCSFLENITEELEEKDLQREGAISDPIGDDQEAVFENYKFVSRDDVDKLGISDLVGTPLLRGYMHGFFMDINLYNKVKAVANPFEYEEYRKKKLKEKIEAKRASRIAPKESSSKPKVAVNPELAERLQSKAADSTKSGKLANNLLSDDRFGNLFDNPDFQIDEDDEDFKLRNPSGVAASKKKRKDDMDSDDDDEDDSDQQQVDSDDEDSVAGFQRVGKDDDDEDSEPASDPEESDSDSDEDGFRGGKVRGEAYDEVKKLYSKPKKLTPSKQKTKRKSKPKMFEADAPDAAVQMGLGDSSASQLAKKKAKTMNIPLEKRFQMEEFNDSSGIKSTRGSKEMTYIPKDSRKKDVGEQSSRRSESGSSSKRQRRGVKDLGFKTPFKNR